MIEFSVLGPAEVVAGSAQCSIGSPFLRAWPARLLLDPGSVERVDPPSLIFGGEAPPANKERP